LALFHMLPFLINMKAKRIDVNKLKNK
jgi:hypothetical protein